jgi:hypothetical protein
MSLDAGKENALAVVDVASPERPNGNEALGLLFSAILHGVVLLLVLVVAIFGSEGSEGGLEIVPVEVELIQQSEPAPSCGPLESKRPFSLRGLPMMKVPAGIPTITGRSGHS